MFRLLPIVVWSIPTIVLAAPTTFCELVKLFVNIFNGLTALMVLAALVAYLYAIFRHMNQVGESSRTKLKNVMLWGFVGLFVMVSIWGILRILQDTFFRVNTPTGTAQVC